MLESLFVVGGSVLTLFLLMSVGFLFGRMGLLSGDTLSQVSRILLYVVTPCIMLTSFEVERTAENQAQLLAALAAMAGLYVAYMLLSQVLFPRAGEAHQGIMRFAAVYGNAGFMGLPLIQSVMGDEAMMVAVVGLGIFNAVSWTQGRALIGGRKELSLKKLALNPGIIGFVGGLLEHTLNVLKLCDFYAANYPMLKRDLLLTAAMFHDIGKLKELSVFPANDYTDDGQLLGHIIIGTEMVNDKIKTIAGFPPKLASELKHCILAHHGELEYGSPKKPALLEALALNFADNTDAKMETMIEALNANSEAKGWLGFNRLLETNIRRTGE